jgi:hypothetical protein
MVFVRDEGGEFDAPLEQVWKFVGSGARHSAAHHHRKFRRRRLPGNAGEYSWEQDFGGRPQRFTMRWTSFYPVGVGYQVREGPLAGSRFLLYYLPRGRRTGVTVVGDFVSPTIAPSRVAAAVTRFFAVEFAQDRAAIAAERPSRSPSGPRSSGARAMGGPRPRRRATRPR